MQDPNNRQRSVSILVYKTLNSVFRSGRKIIIRVCEVASVKNVKSHKMFNLYSSMNRRGTEEKDQKELETTGHDRFCQTRLSRIRSASSEHESSETEQSEKSPLVTAKLETFAKLLFNRSMTQESTSSCKDNVSPTRHSLKFQYSALDSGSGQNDRSPRERAARERALCACQEWLKTLNGRYEIMAHLDDIGSRNNKNWFLLNDTTVRTDRLMTLLPIPPDCVALEELPPSECPKGVLMELLGSLQHPYVYPVLDLGFLYANSTNYACLVMPFNLRGSLKDLIYKAQWNESWNRKYTRKSTCLPLSQVQRLGRQILEALLFLRERGFPSHGHLHSGNIILQNGVARLSGLENGLLGLNSRVNAVMWSRNVSDIENMDIICFGHLLFEMCAGYELNSPQPTPGHYELDLDKYPQVIEVLQMIFESPDRYPTIEELVLCDLFRNIDLREMRGPGISSFKPGLSTSTLSLLNAVRRRQGASLSGSYSEGSSPGTPPSTPRDRRTGRMRGTDSLDITSDSDDALDEIVITPSSFDFPQYDLLNAPSSPIHICDASNQSDDTTTQHRSVDEQDQSLQTCNQLSTESCTSHKNSTSRRMEYSRGMKPTSNPSQDSAFGSMTDESIASSSLRLSSFQSISSPIDEGVEDVSNLAIDSASPKTDSNKSSPCKDSTSSGYHQNEYIGFARSTSDSVSLERKSIDNVLLEPPKILVTDQSSMYTTSPSKSCATVEVFSQKYRVSSFEDMSMKRTSLRNVNKLAFRSLEEERRIDSAFTPVCSPEASVNNTEKFKKLTHAVFSRKITTTKERHTKWKNSILARKNNLIKSNESLLDNAGHYQQMNKRVNSTNELLCHRYESDNGSESVKNYPRKSRSERHLFSLTKLKQSAITDYDECDDERLFSIVTRKEVVSFNNESSSSSDSSPNHRDVCQIIGGLEPDPNSSEEKTPLLDGMEMSPISPIESDEML
ncbi:uncharacterized protein LOC119076930 isoform X3 [Bradysia coprophila]|uniref:uncharacterized protein LOC119076930 isoform X3 n=1 Tax=Bradysia coprophila TaxID=38358 RepID=UPI00187D87E1|nr:uncharacterized protein LOC119076930 isoform X3 [Bradysia coprophila]